MNNWLLRWLGWRALVLQADPTVYDRWNFLRTHLRAGALSTLDAGCGAGEFTLYAAQIGNHALGLSHDERLNQIGRARAALLKLDRARFLTVDLRKLDQLAEGVECFDQIVCFETLEHILDDRKLVADLARALKPQGRLLVTTPYRHARTTGILSATEDGGHVRAGYTFEEMRALFAASGLTIAHEQFLSGLVSQTLATWLGRAGRWRKMIWGITLPLRVFQSFDNRIARYAGYPYLCIAIVGIKQP